ncbi:MAG TPA: spirocyclase AveC family protein [Nocardioides sp.]|nr:spirocyclase AveC family protein [Nocardioides sp.]
MTARPEAPHAPGRTQAPPGPLTFWSAFGAVAVTLAAYCWGRWVLSDDFTRTTPGDDPYRFLWYLRAFEVLSITATVGMLWWFVVRPWWSTRHVPLDGKILLGMMVAYVVDPTLNLFNHSFAMNAHSLSFGSWATYLPLFPSPGQERFAEGLLWAQPLYMYFGLLAAMGGCWVLGRLRRSLPRLGVVGHYALLFGLFIVADCVAEVGLLVYPQMYVFPGVPKDFSLFPGRIYQFPLYQSLFAAVFATMVTWLRDSVDETGRSAVERGVDALPISSWRKQVLSYLAVTGFCTASALSYFLPYSFATMYADTYIDLPSYLDDGAFCGTERTPSCPSQRLDRLEHPPVRENG